MLPMRHQYPSVTSSKGERQHTPSDNKSGRAQNSNMNGSNNPKTFGGNFEETKHEAFDEGRESGLNESGKHNEPLRNMRGKD
jgi:hypothetical protein